MKWDVYSVSSYVPLVDDNLINDYITEMSTQQLTSEAMALPLSERVFLAQALWQSIDAGLSEVTENESIKESLKRDEELSSEAVTGRTHEQVMQAARRAIG